MKYATFESAKKNNKELEAARSLDDFVNIGMQSDDRDVEDISVSELNDRTPGQLNDEKDYFDEVKDAKKLKVFTPAEFKKLPVFSDVKRAQRRIYSTEIHRKYYERLGKKMLSKEKNTLIKDEPQNNTGNAGKKDASKTTADLRYVDDLMLLTDETGKVSGKNNEILKNINNPGAAQKKVLGYHLDMLRKLDEGAYDIKGLASEEFTDEQLVDKFERIHFCSSITTQFSNIKKYLNENIKPADDEESRQLNECMQLMDKYEPYKNQVRELDVRVSMIDDPLYELFDINSKEFNTLARLDGNVKYAKYFKDDTDKNKLRELLGLERERSELGIENDIKAAKKHFESIGVKDDELEIRFIKDGSVKNTQPFSENNARTALTENYNARIEIVNKNDPTSKVALFCDTHGEFAKKMLRNEKTPPQKPKEPGFFKKLMHKLGNSNYKKEFDEYYKQKTAYDAYHAKKTYDDTVAKERAAQKANEEKIKEAKAAAERMKERQKNEVFKKLPNGLRSQKDFDFHAEIGRIMDGDGSPKNEKMRNYLMTAEKSELEALFYKNSARLIDIDATIDSLANGGNKVIYPSQPQPRKSVNAAEMTEKQNQKEEVKEEKGLLFNE